MLDMNMFLRRKSKVGKWALQCLEWKEPEISGTVAAGRLEETSVSRSNIWQENISGRGNGKETSVATFERGRQRKWEMRSEGKGGKQVWSTQGVGLYMERPLSSDQDLACCVEESGLFLHPGESH